MRPLADYLVQFPGYEQVIRKEYRSLQAEAGEDEPLGRIREFELLEKLGGGGQGKVFRAYDTRNEREVALKVLDGPGRPSEAEKRLFKRTATLAAGLSHPSICPIFDNGVDEQGRLFLVMQLIDGARLSNLILEPHGGSTVTIAPANRRELETLLLFLAEAARALEHAHKSGVLHGDVKPDNIMVDANGRPVLLDFGAARHLAHERTPQTAPNTILGTTEYMAPELLNGAVPEGDARAEVYSLGVVLYECLTGERPFAGHTREALVSAILEQQVPDLRARLPRAGRDLQAVVETALEGDLGRRYRTAADLADELDRLVRHEPVLARRASVALKIRRWAQRKPQVAASLGALLLVLLVALGVTLELLDRASHQRDKADESAYAAGIVAADGSLRLGDSEEARRRLEMTPEGLRGWEFDHLYLRSNTSLRALEEAGRAVLAWGSPAAPTEVLVADRDRQLRLIDLAATERTRVLAGLDGPVLDLTGDRDAGLVVACEASAARLLFVGTSPARSLVLSDIQPSPWRAASLLSGDRVLLSGRGAQVVRFSNNPPAILEARRLEGLQGEVLDIAGVLNGRWFAVATRSHNPRLDRIEVRSAQSLEVVWSRTMYGAGLYSSAFEVHAIALSPDGRRLAVSTTDWYDQMSGSQLRVYDVESGELLVKRELPADGIDALAFSPSGDRIVAACSDHSLRVLDSGLNRVVSVILGNEARITDVGFSPDGAYCMSANGRGRVNVFHAERGEGVIQLLKEPCTTTSLRFSEDGNRLAAGSDGSELVVWALPSGRRLFRRRPGPHNSVGFAADGLSVIHTGSNTGSLGSTAILRSDGSSEGTLMSALCSESIASPLALSGDGAIAAWACARDRTPYIGNLATGTRRPLAALPAETDLTCLVIARSGELLLGGDSDGMLSAWRIDTGELLWRRPLAKGRIECLAVDRTGSRVAAGDSTGALWLYTPGSEPLLLDGGSSSWTYAALAFCPDATRLAAARTEGPGSVVRIWDTERREMLLALRGMGAGVRALAWSPTGDDLAAGGEDQRIFVWTRRLPEPASSQRDARPSQPSLEELSIGINPRRLLDPFSDPFCQRWAAGILQERALLRPWDLNAVEGHAIASYRRALLQETRFSSARQALAQATALAEQARLAPKTWIPRALTAACLALEGERDLARRLLEEVEREWEGAPPNQTPALPSPLLEEVRILVHEPDGPACFMNLVSRHQDALALSAVRAEASSEASADVCAVAQRLLSLDQRTSQQLALEAWLIARDQTASPTEWSRAADLLDQAGRGSDDLRLLETRALVAYRRGDVEQSRSLSLALLSRFPAQGEAVLPTTHALLTLCELRRGDLRAASEYYNRLRGAELHPRHAGSWRPSSIIEEAHREFAAHTR